MFRNIQFSAVPRLTTLCLAAVLFLVSCKTARDFAESGDYDGAIDLCIRKLQGKKNKKEEYVKGLEVAFAKAQTRDLAAIDNLDGSKHPENWARIHQIHRQIEARQAKVEPLLPLAAKGGYRADIELLNIAQLEQESREGAANFLYARAERLLEKAESGDKRAARAAYDDLTDLERRYFRNYKDKNALQQRARSLGTTHILFEVKNQSDKLLPKAFAERVLTMSKKDLDTQWKSYHFAPEPGLDMDYKAVFKVQNIDISPERIREREYVDEQEIEDGWDYVLDAQGNVKKDSLGHDIKVKRYARVRAYVLESLQTKAARLSGRVEIFAMGENSLLDARDLSTEVVFEHFASTFRGDARALSNDSRCRIGNSPQPFPTDEELLVQAAERVKPEIRSELGRSGAIL